MAEGFDEYEMKDFDVDKLENYSNDQLNDYFNEISEERNRLYKIHGDNDDTPEEVRVKYENFDTTLNAIEEARDRYHEQTEIESSFIDSGDGKTVTIKKGIGDRMEAPQATIVSDYKRSITSDKKANICHVLGLDYQFRVKDGKNSKELIRDTTIAFNSKRDKTIGLKYKGVSVYVSDDGGKSYRKTTDKRNLDVLKEFESVRQKAVEEYEESEKEKQRDPLVETTPKQYMDIDIHGLTPKENSELRGVLTPNKSIDPRTRSQFLKAQADHFQETINETKKPD